MMTATYLDPHRVRQNPPIPLTENDQLSRSCSRSRDEAIRLFSHLNLLRSRTDRRRSSVCSTPTGVSPTPDFTRTTRKELSVLLQKLSGSRENAKRLLRLGTSMNSIVDSPTTPRAVSEINLPPSDVQMGSTDNPDPVSSQSRSSSVASMVGRRTSHDRSGSPASDLSPSFPVLRNEKVVSTGVGITVSIALAEPALFLPAYDHSDPSTKKSAILRGYLHLRTTKVVKIKKVSVCFRGHAQTDWPDGIPPKKTSYHDKRDVVTHGLVYLNLGEPALVQNDYGAHRYQLARTSSTVTTKESKNVGVTATTRELLSKGGSVILVSGNTPKEIKRLSLPAHSSHSSSKSDPPSSTPISAQRTTRLFPPGDYFYDFEFPIDGSLPETIKTDLAFVKYDLEAVVERTGALRPNLLGAVEVPVIRTPAEGSLEQVEPIAISRNWEDQLHYDIVISGKSFPLGSQIPVAFKLTPLAKVGCHRIRVYVTENVQHWTSDRTVHRLQPSKKILLFEKRAGMPSVSMYPGSVVRVTAGGGIGWDHREAAARGIEQVDRTSTSLLGHLDNDIGSGPTEMEFNVQLPSCQGMKTKDESQRLHFDTTYENIQINHWIKIVMRMSKVDESNPSKRRHFEISIDSPFHILSCMATQANLYLPAYSSPSSEPVTLADEFECGCPGAPVSRTSYHQRHRSSSGRDDHLNCSSTTSLSNPGSETSPSFAAGAGGLARPEQAHLAHEPNERGARPVHLLRAPSFAPPAFEDVPPPPPLVTPPPDYTSIVGDSDREAVLSDYFQRLSNYEDEDDGRGRARVDLPLTPGRRVNRSMDVPRDWV